MLVSTLCTRDVACCNSDTSARGMAQLMRERHVGELLVTEMIDGRLTPLGIVTDRDLVVEVMATEVSPDAMTAADLMTTSLLCVQESDAVDEAIERMAVAGVRRVPVLDVHGALVGVLSVDDVTGFLAKELSDVGRIARRQISCETSLRMPL